ncbi:MAG: O-antigen ligase family protein [bacterium]|nr:O-antigen ligase family protein [bacterium]
MINFYKISKYLLYLAPFAVVIVSTSTLFPFIVGKYTFFKVVIELALIAFVLGWGLSSNYKLPAISYKLFKRPLVIAVTLFVAIFTLSGFTGVNPSASFWSNFERGEGSFLLLHFYAYFILLISLLKEKKDWTRFFGVAIASGVLVMLYGVMAASGATGFVGNGWCDRFAGSLGNPAYIGTFSIFMLFYVAYLLVSGKWRSANWQTWALPLLVILFMFFSAFLLLSQTRGGLFGLGVGIISSLVYSAFTLPSTKWRRIVIGFAVGFILLGIIGINFRQYIDLAPWCKGGGNRILDVSLGGETINTRFALWTQAIEAWKESPKTMLIGWGPENFSIAFEKYYNPIHKVWFDRAHNIFFDYLVFSGILGLFSFIGMFAVFFWQLFIIKSEKRSETLDPKNYQQNMKAMIEASDKNLQSILQRALILGLPIAYLMQGLVLFDVLPIYINLFLFLAFATWKLESQNDAKSYAK